MNGGEEGTDYETLSAMGLSLGGKSSVGSCFIFILGDLRGRSREGQSKGGKWTETTPLSRARKSVWITKFRSKGRVAL